MIGGIDVSLPPLDLIVVFNRIRQIWPDAVLEDDNGMRVSLDFGLPPSGFPCEVFIYKNEDALLKWVQGASPKNRNTMIHVIPGSTEMTLVVDEKVGEMQQILNLLGDK